MLSAVSRLFAGSCTKSEQYGEEALNTVIKSINYYFKITSYY